MNTNGGMPKPINVFTPNPVQENTFVLAGSSGGVDGDTDQPSSSCKRKRVYASYLCKDNPMQNIPRASLWRLLKATRQNSAECQNVKPTDKDRKRNGGHGSQSCTTTTSTTTSTTNFSNSALEAVDGSAEWEPCTVPAGKSGLAPGVSSEPQPSDGECISDRHMESPQLCHSPQSNDVLMDDGEMTPSSPYDISNFDWEDGPVGDDDNVEDDFDDDEEDWFDARSDDLHMSDSEDDCHDDDSDTFFNFEHPLNSQKLYPGCNLSLAESMAMILLFVLRHRLTSECLADLLTLISLHCAVPNICINSVHLFWKYFRHLKSPVIFHKYCSFCFSPIETESARCNICHKDAGAKNTSFFIECPLVSQVVTLFKRDGIYSDLQHRFQRMKHKSVNIEDIYDGELYRKHMGEKGFLRNKNNFSLMWYTDGVPLFKSSKYSLWPLYFVINELPFTKRMRKENMLFGGIWYGESKPLFHVFLKPSIRALQKLYDGVEVSTPDGTKLETHAILLSGTCDLPAKCLVLNMNQFNGKHGCSKCLQTGLSVATGRGQTWTYPFEMNSSLRTHEQFVENGKQALESGTPVNGIKGPSWLSLCPETDIVRGTAIDYMHCVLLGIIRKLLFLWFDSSCSRKPFSLSKVVSQVDERLLSIRPPNFITRVPRSIKTHCKFWKANECRAWLFFYSVPILFHFMDKLYFDHYCTLVEGVYLLCSESISLEALQKSKGLLQHFCYMFDVLYGSSYMSANLHQLLHLPQCVQDLGPLWVYSCFKFEDLNGKIIQMCHGTKKPELQICNSISTFLNLPLLLSKLPKGESSSFIDQLQCLVKSTNREMVSGDCIVLGGITPYTPAREFVSKVDTVFSSKFSKFSKFFRFSKNGVIFQSRQYYQVSKRNNFTTFYLGDNFSKSCGQIQYLLKCCVSCDGKCTSSCVAKYAAVMKPLHFIDFHFLDDDVSHCSISHIFKVSTTANEDIIVPVESILSIGIFMEVNQNDAFVAVPPNLIESD